MKELEWHDLNWCLRRVPQSVLKLMKQQPNNLVVAGGFIRSCIANETINDIDLFTSNPVQAKSFASEISGKFKFIETDNAYTVTKVSKISIQFIHRWSYPQPEELLKSFDFTIAGAAFWWDGSQWKSLCHDSFYADLAAKRLVYTKPERNEDAGGSMLRVLKFYQRGYRIPLDSMGAVIARLVKGVDEKQLQSGEFGDSEKGWAKIITGLLREVDPNIDPSHIAHLPSREE